MAGLSPRTVLACAIPTFVALISFVWFRKKKRELPLSGSVGTASESNKSLLETSEIKVNVSESNQHRIELKETFNKVEQDQSFGQEPEPSSITSHTTEDSELLSLDMQLKEINPEKEAPEDGSRITAEEMPENGAVHILKQSTIIVKDTLCNEVRDKLTIESDSPTKKFKGHESESRCEIESCACGMINNFPESSTDNDSDEMPANASLPVAQNKATSIVLQDSMQNTSPQNGHTVTLLQSDAESTEQNSSDDKIIRTTVVYLSPSNISNGSDTIQAYSVGEIAVELNSVDPVMNTPLESGVQPDDDAEPLPILLHDKEPQPQQEQHLQPESQVEETKSYDTQTTEVEPAKCDSEEVEEEVVSEQSKELAERADGNSDSVNVHVEPYQFDSSNSSPEVKSTESSGQCTYSDAQSEGSSDSGKGGSDSQMGSESSNVAYVEDGVTMYEFELPQELCGRLIGKQGKHINFVKTQSNANVFLKRHPFTPDVKMCVIEGTHAEINAALSLIRKRFPLSRYPSVSMMDVNTPMPFTCILPHALQLHLPDGVNCDVILSCLINAGHFFLQQPTHPTFTSLSRLDQEMNMVYSMSDPPPLPPNFSLGVICAAPQVGGWFRAAVVSVHDNCEQCDVKFMDYGGYATVPISSLRQIKHEFMTLPFQAKECYLSSVAPINEEEGWSLEASAAFEELAQGQILQAHVTGYSEDGVPYVYLNRIQGVTSIFINRELVNRGLAVWIGDP